LAAVNAPLSLHQITKRFGNVIALDDVSFAVRPGVITALLGENGAGKTTLMRIAFGLIQPDSGWIAVDGIPRRLTSPAVAIGAGVGMVHQQFSLIPAMTVAENVALGGRGRYSFSTVARLLKEISLRTGLVIDPSRRVNELSNAERQKLEIIRTLAHDARILILDEPTAVLTPGDIAELFTQLKAFAQAGNSVVLITHKLADAIQHADEVTVLRHGRVVLSSTMNEVSESSLATAMLGSTPTRANPAAMISQVSQRSVASLTNVSLDVHDGKVLNHDINLEISSGEIVGIAALEGAAAPLLRALAGRLPPHSGQIHLPEDIGFVPENRRDEALIDDFTLTENLALAGAGPRRGLMNWDFFTIAASKVLVDFSVSARTPEVRPQQLSGGNQQRFVLGRELRNDPSLLVLENPTQGLDISASAFVHEQMKQAAGKGAGVVFYSSDIDELAALSNRILVVSPDGIESVKPDRDAIGLALVERERRA
jgi:simple sugar transport system ATP-binding protein